MERKTRAPARGAGGDLVELVEEEEKIKRRLSDIKKAEDELVRANLDELMELGLVKYKINRREIRKYY